MSLTSDRNDPRLKEGQKNETGQHSIYLVLSEEELAKGFVRPVRTTYVHVGKKINDYAERGIILTLQELHDSDPQEYDDVRIEKFRGWGYAAYIKYSDEYYTSEANSGGCGLFLSQDDYDSVLANKTHVGGCGTSTTMGLKLAETYSRDPKFYGATYCVGCGKHLPVSEFVWQGTDETVGS
jgi:hypothetical protein